MYVTLFTESLLIYYTLILLPSSAIKPMKIGKNQIPAAVWLDREKVPIKMFAKHQMNMFKNYSLREVFRHTLLACTTDKSLQRSVYHVCKFCMYLHMKINHGVILITP